MAVDPLVIEVRERIVDHCDTCGGHGYVRVSNGIRDCDCMKVLKYVMALTKAGVPRRYWHLKLADLKVDKEFTKFVHFYISHMENGVNHALGLMFVGSTGIGKTSLACEIAKEAIIRGYPVRYLTVRQYIDSVFEGKPISTSNLKMVIIDEIDKIAIGKSGSEAVLQMVEDFLRANVPYRSVIACSNLQQDEIEEKFGKPTMSLLGRALKIVEMEGEDYKLTAQDEWKTLMTEEYDYLQPAIIEMAERLWARVSVEEEA